MHQLLIIHGASFDTTFHALGLGPLLILTIHLLDLFRSQPKRRISFLRMRESAYEIDQSRGELRKCLQWIGEAEQGMKSVGKRRKRRQ
jgi:hypothetical protein